MVQFALSSYQIVYLISTLTEIKVSCLLIYALITTELMFLKYQNHGHLTLLLLNTGQHESANSTFTKNSASIINGSIIDILLISLSVSVKGVSVLR